MSEIKNGGLDQYGAETFEQQQFGTAGVEGVNGSLQVLRERGRARGMYLRDGRLRRSRASEHS